MWRWRLNSLTFRLTGTLIVTLVLLLGLTAVVQATLQEHCAHEAARINGLAMAETLFGALHTAMLNNDRQGLHASVRLITEQDPDVRVRIFNKEGVIVFSSEDHELGTRVDRRSEACFKCHAANRPLDKLPPGDRTRTFTLAGAPALGVIRPIENEPSCINAGCHAHPASKQLLGVLDVTLLLTHLERARRQATFLMITATGGVLLLVVGVVLFVVRNSVHRPIRTLSRTLAALGTGDYSARYEDGQISEFAYLGRSVNKMAQDLEHANAELVQWAQTLERRVDEKTAELRQAQEQMMRVERMASLGKLAAVVAHEINNPLASVVTYSKVLLRRFTGHTGAKEETRENLDILEAIASESARCGEIVSNLLLFARRTGSHMEPTNVNQLVDRALFLIKHKMDLAQVKPVLHLAPELPLIMCDPSQVEQALLALCINAVEAMPNGGALTLRTSPNPDGGITAVVEDTGSGIPDEVRAHIFEPFVTTKGEGEGKGLGLGLAVVYGIIQRHNGTIDVASAPGEGTRFTLTFPAAPAPAGDEVGPS
jgi:two-component system NtrC family sensor kinase